MATTRLSEDIQRVEQFSPKSTFSAQSYSSIGTEMGLDWKDVGSFAFSLAHSGAFGHSFR